MGCTSKNQTVDEDNDEIKNYDERDNFYSFHQKKGKNNNRYKSNNKDQKNTSSNDNSDDDNKNERNKNKKGDLNGSNSYENNNDSSKKQGDNDNYNDESNSNSPNRKINGINNKKNNILLNKSIDETSESKLFKENSGEMEYYSKKLKQKKEGINDNDSNYSKVMYDYKNIFNDNGEKIPEYKVYARNNKKDKEKKHLKKSKLNGIIIVENLKEYFPKDISRDEIQELVFEAFGDNIVEDDDLIIPGQTASYDQVLQLSDYVFNYIKGNEKKMKENHALKNLNVKIDLVPLDKNLIKDKLYKGKDLSERQLDNAMDSYTGKKRDVKVLTIEFL